MEFILKKENCTIDVTRVYNALLADVWAAWTEPDILDQWWAPKPYESKTKTLDFRVGGRHLYAMVGPKGEEHWSVADFTSITPKSNFQALDGFCDENGNINPNMPRSKWNVNFTETNGKTTLHVQLTNESQADLEMLIKMGFKEGFTATLEELANLLAQKK